MPGLTKKQQLFIEEYFKTNMNATEAALRAYATDSRQTAGVIGFENLRKPKIAEIIQKRLDEHAMSANEVLYRLAEHGRAAFDLFLDEDGELTIASINEAREAGYGHLIKKFIVRPTKYGEVIALELHDPQTALTLLGKHHKLFTDRQEHRWDDEQLEAMQTAKGTLKDKLAQIAQQTQPDEDES